MTMATESVVIEVRAGAAQESQSGLQALNPRIWGALARPETPTRVCCIVIHPTSNFMGHYLLAPLAARGVAALGLNTRYMGNDSVLLLERAIQDLGAGVKWLHAQGFTTIVLIGNSGGGALVSLYQAQAEHLTISHAPSGDAVDLQAADLPPAQGIALCAAHLGRSRLMRMWADPAVIDETDPVATDPALDMFDAGQRTALRRRRSWSVSVPPSSPGCSGLEDWCKARLRQLRAIPGWVAGHGLRRAPHARRPAHAGSLRSTRMTARRAPRSGARRNSRTSQPTAWAATPR